MAVLSVAELGQIVTDSWAEVALWLANKPRLFRLPRAQVDRRRAQITARYGGNKWRASLHTRCNVGRYVRQSSAARAPDAS